MDASTHLTALENAVVNDLERGRSAYDTLVRSEGRWGGDRSDDIELNRAINAAVKVINDRHRRRELGLRDQEDIAP